jgi:uracil-DNA glycosylase family 4
VSDAHDRLRQYLEQRREMGESEFILDGMSVEEALKVLTGKVPPETPRERSASGPVGQRAVDSAMRRNAEEAAAGGDWRDALRAVDAGEQTPKPAAARPAPPAMQAPAKSETPTAPAEGARRFEVGTGAARSSRSDLTDLAAVAHAIAGCKACSLSATALNHVPGEGNPAARFVVVGEAPGQTEDELGRPFVGKSGELLTKILEAIGFKREDVFICNVLKHRPPGNRNPAPDEIAACRPFLLRQLELLEPKVILALGTFAAQTLLETDSPIGKLRGLEHRYHGIPLVATYHPAALLRNPNWKRPAWEDVQLARRIFDRP